jgi:hypothetical protein
MSYTYFKIKDLAEMIKNRQLNRKDAAICIVGFKGQGKSTAAWKIARRLKKTEVEHSGIIYKTRKFKPERDMFYARQNVLDFIVNRKYSVGVVDELINVGYNREFSSTDQQAIVKALNQFRSPNYNVYLMCNPFFYDLDPDFRNLFWMRLDVIRRGIALVHTVNESIYGNDPWDTNYNKKVEEKWRKKDGTIKPKYRQLTTFRGILLYSALSTKEEAYYERVRNEKRATANKYLTNQVPEKTATIYDNLMKMALSSKLTHELLENVCAINNLSYQQTRSYINRKLRETGLHKTLKELIKKIDKKEEIVQRVRI